MSAEVTTVFKSKKYFPKIALILEGVALYFWGKLIIDTNGRLDNSLAVMERKYLFTGISLLIFLAIIISVWFLFRQDSLILSENMLINQNAQNGVTHMNWQDIDMIKTSYFHRKLLIFINADLEIKYLSNIRNRKKLHILEKNTQRYKTPYVIDLNRFTGDKYDMGSTIKNYFRKHKKW